MTYRYDIAQRPVALLDAQGGQTVSFYDDANQLLSVRDPLGNSWTFSYTPDRQIAGYTDRRGTAWRMEYDEFGQLVQEIADEGGLNLVTRYEYDARGRLVSRTDPTGVVTAYAYDALSRLVQETRDAGGLNLVTRMAYDARGNVRRVTDPRGVVNTFAYDALGRQTAVTVDEGGLNHTIQFTYDEYGNLQRSSDPRGIVVYQEYDALNRLVLERQDEGGLSLDTRYSYDRLGYLERQTEANGRVTYTEHNAFGFPVRQVRDEGGLDAETRFTYDNALRLVGMTDANGQVTRFAYDALDRLVAEFYPDDTTVRYTYDAEGNRLTRVNQALETITYTYDALGRPIQRSLPGGSQQTYAYDGNGLLTQASSSGGGHTSQVSFGFNAIGDPISTTQSLDGQAWQTRWEYGYASSTVTQTYPSGAVRVYQADAAGRLQSLKQGSGAPLASYTFDDPNGRYTLQHGNGLQTTIRYDGLYRITDIESPVAHYSYTYDPVGNVTAMQRQHVAGAPSDTYQYDGLDQLVRAHYGLSGSTVEYTLDRMGNRLLVNANGVSQVYLPNDGSRLTDPMNRYAQVGSALLSYDPKGNLLSDGSQTYTYDAVNRMTGLAGPGGTAEYVYDALDRRIAKVVNGVTTHLVLDMAGQVIEERDGSGQLLARYTYDLGVDHPLAMERGGATYYYHTDMLGSITEVTDGSGALVERYTYDVYGRVSMFDASGNPRAASAIGNPYLFVARRLDSESGLYDYRARMYDPGLGRFMQMDPAGYVDGLNLYTYAGNNPALYRDPMGLQRCRGEVKTVADDICSTEWAKAIARKLQAEADKALAMFQGARESLPGKTIEAHLTADLPATDEWAFVGAATRFIQDYGREIGTQLQMLSMRGGYYGMLAPLAYAAKYTSAFLNWGVATGGKLVGGLQRAAGALGRGALKLAGNPLVWKGALVAAVAAISFCGTNYLMHKTGLDRVMWDVGALMYDLPGKVADGFDSAGRWLGAKAYDAYEATENAAKATYQVVKRGVATTRRAAYTGWRYFRWYWGF